MARAWYRRQGFVFNALGEDRVFWWAGSGKVVYEVRRREWVRGGFHKGEGSDGYI